MNIAVIKKLFTEDLLHLGHLSLLFIGFAILYFTTAMIMDVNYRSITKQLAARDIFGPIVIDKADTVVEVNIENKSLRESWAFVEATVEDERGKVITTFGGESYHETGRDSDGYWSELENANYVKVVLPKPGKYFVKFRVEGAPKYSRSGTDWTSMTSLNVTAKYKLGGTGLLNFLGVMVLLIGLAINEVRNRTILTFLFAVLVEAFGPDDD